MHTSIREPLQGQYDLSMARNLHQGVGGMEERGYQPINLQFILMIQFSLHKYIWVSATGSCKYYYKQWSVSNLQ